MSTRKFWIQGKRLIPLSCQKNCEQMSSKSCLVPTKFTRTAKIGNIIEEPKQIVIDENENFFAYGTATEINVPIFLYDLQQPTKKLCEQQQC